jgi:hypothetical protein
MRPAVPAKAGTTLQGESIVKNQLDHQKPGQPAGCESVNLAQEMGE